MDNSSDAILIEVLLMNLRSQPILIIIDKYRLWICMVSTPRKMEFLPGYILIRVSNSTFFPKSMIGI